MKVVTLKNAANVKKSKKAPLKKIAHTKVTPTLITATARTQRKVRVLFAKQRQLLSIKKTVM
jgi:hypothetical protein